MIYRKRPHKPGWHFREDCYHWPTDADKYEEKNRKPRNAILCKVCVSKQNKEAQKKARKKKKQA